MQTEVTLTKTPITAVLESRCHQFDHDEEGNITGCLRSYDMEPTALNIGPNIYGIAMRFNEGETLNAVFLPVSETLVVDLPDNPLLTFNNITKPGLLKYNYKSVKDYPGYKNIKGNIAKHLEIEGAEFGSATFTASYDSTGLTASQEAGQKGFKITDKGIYKELPTIVDTVNKTEGATGEKSLNIFII